ncbi:hypothetical protein SERLA73DRAFT_163809 [Serpula lacrymans var. lacrymans S7.3]|uniref:Cytochrome P450 n=1 Tax=Serpula lacrymans var. lacrymans (strain S7.3) TaxID=936435 RepID=F8QFL1_SERL3|nr:hypothetical protein SERLA73DRAFT_163809 [Serpula lacrymans var. lacrymans S7.3]
MLISGLNLQTLLILLGSVALLRTAKVYTNFRRAIRSIRNLPGHRTFLSSSAIIVNFLPPIRGISLGRDGLWNFKHSIFAEKGLDIVSNIAAWPKTRVSLWIADADVIKEIVWSRSLFPKPLQQYKVLTFFGGNVVSSEGDEWKRYRKIVAPAFTDRNNKLVWDETCRIMLDLFNNVWTGKDEVTIDHGVDLTLPIALFVIGAAGFGRRISWQEDAIIPPGHKMTFRDSLHIVTTNLAIKLVTPKWAYGLNKRLERVGLAFDELERYLYEMIQSRKSGEIKEERHDLFNSLLAANDDMDLNTDEVRLADSELVGNIFIFLVAGHETTAHSLCFSLAMLALYPDEQEILYNHVKSVLPDGRMPTYEDMPQLNRSLAVFNETLRMFPPVLIFLVSFEVLSLTRSTNYSSFQVTGIPKNSAEDATFVVRNAAGENTTVAVPKDTKLTFDVPGLHYNPRYWEDPHTFKPSRFLGDWNRDAFIPFSAGHRGCVGRKFSETEGTAVLTLLIMQYKVEIQDERQFRSETFEQKKARVLDVRTRNSLTLAGKDVPFVFASPMWTSNTDGRIIRWQLLYIDYKPDHKQTICFFRESVKIGVGGTDARYLPTGPDPEDGLNLQTLLKLLGSVALLRAAQVYIDFRRAIRSTKYLPGHRTLLSSTTILGNLVPAIRGISLGRDGLWNFKHSIFAEKGLDIISSIAAWPISRISIWVADAEVIKEIVWSRSRFPKPLHQYSFITFFGGNIVVSEGDEWKRYRKIVAPAFSDRNNKLVWDETCRIMLDLFDHAWAGKDEITIDHGVDLTLPIALFVIGAAGFGRSISWQEDEIIPPGHKMTFKDSLHTVTTNLIIKLVVPKWAYGLSKRLERVGLAFDELERYLYEMIQSRKNGEAKEERHDLFNSLLAANDDVDLTSDEVRLSDSELIGNIFIFLVAGHETTAHSLCFSLAMLALYPDEQEIIYNQIRSVLPDGRMPTYEDMPRLTRSLAVFNETLRMFPPVTGIPKTSVEDATFVVPNAAGENTTVTVPQGSVMDLDVAGLHYNPRYWEEPHTFKPSRFLGDWNRDAFIPFSAGYRGCVGRKFSETEGTAVLTLFVMQFKIEIKDEPQFRSETFEQKKARVLDAKSGITLAPTRTPLVFKRRK